MGNCAENTAKNMGISRQQQDDYAINSYKKSALAYSSGAIAAELAQVPVPQKKGIYKIKIVLFLILYIHVVMTQNLISDITAVVAVFETFWVPSLKWLEN